MRMVTNDRQACVLNEIIEMDGVSVVGLGHIPEEERHKAIAYAVDCQRPIAIVLTPWGFRHVDFVPGEWLAASQQRDNELVVAVAYPVLRGRSC